MVFFRKVVLMLCLVPISIFAFKQGDWFGSAHLYNHHSIKINTIETFVLKGKKLKFGVKGGNCPLYVLNLLIKNYNNCIEYTDIMANV